MLLHNTWSLQTGEAPPTKVFVQLGAGLAEGIHEPDERDLVDEHDFADGGKFRCERIDIFLF
jgi:hypothetical protein